MSFHRISKIIIALGLASTTFAQTTSTVDFAAKPKPTSQMPFFSVGSDRAAIFLRDTHQRDLVALQKSLHFRYLRCHGIFNEEMNVVKRNPDGTIAYNWQKVDKFVDQLKATGLRPFVEFGYMPEALARGKDTVFYYRGNSTPPKSPTEWADLVKNFLLHEIQRFGIKEVRQWFFEVWNEPNLDYFWRGTQKEYFEFYDVTARTVKSVDAKLPVGGPSTAGLGWIKEFLTYCSEKHVPIDFVSSHHYGATQGFVDPDGKSKTILDTRPEALYADLIRAREDIRKSPFPKLPFYISEWGPSYSQVDPIHDNYICAAWILDKLQKSRDSVDGMSYWAFSDQFEEGGPQNDPFPGGFGLLNYDGLRKPGFFAYDFLAKLQKNSYNTNDDHLLASKSGDNLALVTWNYTEPKITKPNNPLFHEDIVPSNLPDKVITLKGLRPGSYVLKMTCMGYERNDVYAAYRALGSPKGKGAGLQLPIQEKLRAATTGQPMKTDKVTVSKDGQATLTVPMRTNDCWLIELTRSRS